MKKDAIAWVLPCEFKRLINVVKKIYSMTELKRQ